MAPLKRDGLLLNALVHFYFHDYFVMAPLKPLWRAGRKTRGRNFHDYFVMAPLKRLMSAIPTTSLKADFHDYFVMAPLKPTSSVHKQSDATTSMTILSWPHWSFFKPPDPQFGFRYFHDYFVMAPLKQPCLLPNSIPHPYFHDYFVMAPLKLVRLAGTAAPSPTSMTILSWPHWSQYCKLQ